MTDLFAISLHDLLNPDFYIHYGGLWALLFIIFAETGLMVGFFLPGDSLLFVAGIYSDNLMASFPGGGLGGDFGNLFFLFLMVAVCGIIGNTLGYWFGHKSGPYLYHRKETFFYKKKYLYQAHEFYELHGGQAIVFARFLPIIRTFAPIIAGIVAMDRKKFTYFNVIGCLAWTLTMLFAGHYLYRLSLVKFHFDLKQHLEVIVIGIVIITTFPVIFKLFFGRRKKVRAEDPYKN